MKTFPRKMWADVDTEDRLTPVVIYPTRAEQRGTRPDLKPVRVVVTEATPAPFKVYNQGDHLEAIKARREAVLFLITRGYSFRAAGYAVGKTGNFARSAYAKARRSLQRSAQFAPNHTRHNPLG